MSKSSVKHEKFSCIANCLPIKACLPKSKRSSSKGAKSLPTCDSVAYNLTGGGGRKETVFELDESETRNEHTKQWLQNLSTMVAFDPSYLDNSALDNTLTENSPPVNDRHVSSQHRSKTTGRIRHDSEPSHANKIQYPDASYMLNSHRSTQPCFDDSYCSYTSSVSSHRNNDGQRINNSLASSERYSECFDSSNVCDSSHLSSKCCSQQRRRWRRRGPGDRSYISSSTITCGGQYPRNHNNGNDTSSIYSGGSTVSLATELVTLNLDAFRNLGITIVGHSNGQDDCGIFVGCVKKGGAAAHNGRIEPGDLILEVNNIDLEHMSNERALEVLKAELAKGGTVQLLVAKYWDMNSSVRGEAKDAGCRLEPLYEAVGSARAAAAPSKRPVSTMVDERGCAGKQIVAMQPYNSEMNMIVENSDGGHRRKYHEAIGSSTSDLTRQHDQMKVARISSAAGCLTQQNMHVAGPATTVLQTSSGSSIHTGYPDSGYHDADAGHYGTADNALRPIQRGSTLDRHMRSATGGRSSVVGGVGQHGASDKPPRPFCGVELVEWIQDQVPGLCGRKDAQSYAQNLLHTGHIYNIDPRQSSIFHEHNYYVFGRSSAPTMVDDSRQSKML